MSPTELPTTIEACHALILQQAEINQQQAVVIDEQLEIIGRLQDDMKLLKRALFGNRRERFTADDPDQLYLFGGDAASNQDDSGQEADEPEEDEPEEEANPPRKRRSRGRGRRVFPEFFARERKEHLLEDDEIPAERKAIPQPSGSSRKCVKSWNIFRGRSRSSNTSRKSSPKKMRPGKRKW